MYQHDRGDMGMEAFGSFDIPVISTPEKLAPGVDAFNGRAALIAAFKFHGGTGNRRKTPQINGLFDPYRLTEGFIFVAPPGASLTSRWFFKKA